LSGLGLDRLNKASTIPGLNREDAYSQRLLLPPLEEQRRIVTILDQVNALLGKRRTCLGYLKSLTSSLFIELFGDPSKNVKGTKVVRLSEITTKITDGVHLKPTYTESGIPFISVKDITSGVLRFDDCRFVSREDHQRFTKRCRAERNDILYTKVGATYGRPALVNTDKEFSIYVSVCLIKPNRDLVEPIFLNTAMSTPAIKSQADRRIKGIGVPDLHLDQIQDFLIPLPPIEEQRTFVDYILAQEHLRTNELASLARLKDLFASIKERAFQGEL
jgi:type I restriction enzyme S subunit